MVKHLTSKIAIAIYLIVFIGLGIWGFAVFKQRDGKLSATVESNAPANTDNSASSPQAQQQSNNTIPDTTLDNITDGNASDANDSTNTDDTSQSPVDTNVPPVSVSKDVSDNILAHITPEHCDKNCKAFASDLELLEYCQQVCGMSPIKNVSNCDDQKDIQKDYCLKDLAIGKQDSSQCDKISDANILQTCKTRITQDIIENQ